MRAQTESDIKYLQKIVVDPAHREAYQVWKSLLANKKEQLGIAEELITVDPAALSAVVDLKRHVS